VLEFIRAVVWRNEVPRIYLAAKIAIWRAAGPRVGRAEKEMMERSETAKGMEIGMMKVEEVT